MFVIVCKMMLNLIMFLDLYLLIYLRSCKLFYTHRLKLVHLLSLIGLSVIIVRYIIDSVIVCSIHFNGTL